MQFTATFALASVTIVLIAGSAVPAQNPLDALDLEIGVDTGFGLTWVHDTSTLGVLPDRGLLHFDGTGSTVGAWQFLLIEPRLTLPPSDPTDPYTIIYDENPWLQRLPPQSDAGAAVSALGSLPSGFDPSQLAAQNHELAVDPVDVYNAIHNLYNGVQDVPMWGIPQLQGQTSTYWRTWTTHWVDPVTSAFGPAIQLWGPSYAGDSGPPIIGAHQFSFVSLFETAVMVRYLKAFGSGQLAGAIDFIQSTDFQIILNQGPCVALQGVVLQSDAFTTDPTLDPFMPPYFPPSSLTNLRITEPVYGCLPTLSPRLEADNEYIVPIDLFYTLPGGESGTIIYCPLTYSAADQQTATISDLDDQVLAVTTAARVPLSGFAAVLIPSGIGDEYQISFDPVLAPGQAIGARLTDIVREESPPK